MDIFVLPSIKEALGIVCVEAQVNGLPVLASTGVAKEMKVAQYVEFIELDYIKWDIQIKKFRELLTNKKINRNDVKINKEYDVFNSMQKLIELYDEGVKKYENTH